MAELTITAIARQVGVRPSTLRYYEKDRPLAARPTSCRPPAL